MNTNLKPRFEVHKMDGEAERTVVTPKVDKDGKLLGGFKTSKVKQDAGWMVYFPSGSSIHIWTAEEMERQGFLSDPELVNMESGDVMGTVSQTSLRSKSEQVSNRTRNSKVAQV